MADLPQHTVLEADLQGGWLTLTMDDPARKNALSSDMERALRETLLAVRDDRSVRGITLKGAGGVFCSGGDLKSMGAGIMRGDREAIVQLSQGAGELFATINSQPQPILVLIDGPALAGGFGVACCADVMIVTPEARFALTETQLGIPPAQIAPYVVARLGLPLARRLMLTGAVFNGREAAALGVADFLAEDAGDLQSREEELKAQILRCAPGALAATKRVALAAAEAPAASLKSFAAETFTDCLLSDEGREGIASFVEKRRPRWWHDD